MLANLITNTGGRKFVLSVLALAAAAGMHLGGVELTDNMMIFLLGISGIYGTVNVSKSYVDKRDDKENKGSDLTAQHHSALIEHENAIKLLANKQEDLYNLIISNGGNNGSSSNVGNVPRGQQG
jgi:hypothetical protein